MGKVLSWVGAASVLVVIGIMFWTSGGLTVSESKKLYGKLCVEILKTRLIRPSGLEVSKLSSFDLSGKGSVYISYSAPNRGGGYGDGTMSCEFERLGPRAFRLTKAEIGSENIWPDNSILLWNDMSDRIEIGGDVIFGFWDRLRLAFWSV